MLISVTANLQDNHIDIEAQVFLPHYSDPVISSGPDIEQAISNLSAELEPYGMFIPADFDIEFRARPKSDT